MSDFESKKSSFEKDTYSVALWTDLWANGDAYEYFCGDHMEALEFAISEHKMAGRPLPKGTHYLVKGPCQDLCLQLWWKDPLPGGSSLPRNRGSRLDELVQP